MHCYAITEDYYSNTMTRNNSLIPINAQFHTPGQWDWNRQGLDQWGSWEDRKEASTQITWYSPLDGAQSYTTEWYISFKTPPVV